MFFRCLVSTREYSLMWIGLWQRYEWMIELTGPVQLFNNCIQVVMSVKNSSTFHLQALNHCLWVICLKPDGPRGSRGGDLAAAIQNQTQCFPSLAGQGVPAIITTCAEITHSALVTPWETWKGESSRKTILVSIFPWLSGTVCRMSIFGHAGSFCDPICGLLRSFQNGWLTVALHAGKWLISSHMLTPLSRVLGWIIDRP